MNQELFSAVDRYIDSLFVPHDSVLETVIRSSIAADMPQIHISPSQGKLLYLLAKLIGAKRILELGTLAGYSTIWLGRALPPDGNLITLEFSPKHAAVAARNIADAGLANNVRIITGPASASLDQLASSNEPPFDLVFIDADKPGYTEYLRKVLPLMRPGALLLADNVIREGQVLDPATNDASALGARAFNEALAAEPRVEAVIVQQIGIKGHDGMAIAVVRP